LKSVEKERNTVMICSAAGDPEPAIVWYKDYVPVDMSDPRRKLLPTGAPRMLFTHHTQRCDDDDDDDDVRHDT